MLGTTEGIIVTNDNHAGDIEATDVVGSGAGAESAHASNVAPASTQYGIGPVTVRELAIVVAWALAFIVSFFSISTERFESVWVSGLLWILTIGVPTVAVFLIVLRRFSPEGIRRVGSLGVDQFASVAFSVSAVLWLQLLWETAAYAADRGPWLRGWVVWVELALMISLVVLTVFAPFIAPLSEDFQQREEAPAHRNARPVRAVIARPRPVAAAPVDNSADKNAEASGPSAFEPEGVRAEPQREVAQTGMYERSADFAPVFDDQNARDAASTHDAAPMHDATTVRDDTSTSAMPIAEAEYETAAQPVHQAFWALAPEERDVVDDHGVPIFSMGPLAWALVIEERDEVFVVRHEDGRIGYLHDVDGVTRG